MGDDLTPEKLGQLRANENPWNDPFTRRELIASREREFVQQDLKEKVDGTWLKRRSPSDRLGQTHDAGESQAWMGPYKDIGIQQVELAQIKDIPERGTLAFEKTSEPEMIEGF